MEAKETLMGDEQIRVTKAEAVRLSWTHTFHPSYEKEKFLLTSQAEISRKACINEVVEWLKENRTFPHHDEWGYKKVAVLLQLKEWGIDGK